MIMEALERKEEEKASMLISVAEQKPMEFIYIMSTRRVNPAKRYQTG